MKALLPEIQSWFERKREHLEIFAAADSRLEGWFKAELLVLFHRLAGCGVIESYGREANLRTREGSKRAQVDFLVRLGEQEHLCELKTLCISQAAGTPRNLKFYFRDDKLGLFKDFRKLDSISMGEKWVLGFIYPRPQASVWNAALAQVPGELGHWVPMNQPSQAPPFLFISLWRSEGSDRRVSAC